MKNSFYILLLLLSISCGSKKKLATNSSSASNKNVEEKVLSESKQREFKQYFFEGMQQKSLNNTDEAIELFKKALAINNKSGASLHEISQLYAYDRNYVDALKYAEKAAAVNDENKWYILQLGLMQKRMLQYDNATKSYEKLVLIDPKNIDFLEELMDMYIRTGKSEKAAELIDQVIDVLGPMDELLLQKQSLYIEAGEIDKAIDEAKLMVNKNPDDPRYLSMLAQLYEQNNEKEKALDVYKKVLELNPSDGVASLSIARFYKNKEQNDKVHPYMKTVFKDDKLSPSLKLTILVDYIEESLKDEEIKNHTIELIEIMQATHPKSVQSFVAAGDFYIQHEKLEESRNAYRKAAALDANSYPIWVQLLTIDLDLRNYNYLAIDSKEAMETFPSQPVFYLYNGMANHYLKKYHEAVDVLTMGKDLVIDNKELMLDFHKSLGEAYHELKQYPQADKNFEKALEINPNQPYLLNNYSYYLSLRKAKLARAAEMAKKANELIENETSFEDTYGWVLFQQENYKEAKEWIENALSHGGDQSAVILEHYGDVLFKLGETEKALTYWKKAKQKEGYSDKLDQKIKEGKYVE